MTHQQLLNMNLAFSMTGVVGVLIAGAILTGLLCARAYKTALQRLFIYTVLIALTQASCHAANIEYRYINSTTLREELCAALGFVSNWASWSLFAFYLLIMLYLLMLVCVQVRASAAVATRSTKTKFLGVLLELVTVVGLIAACGLISSVPYYQKLYGFQEGHCWIRRFKMNSCNETAFLATFLYECPLYELTGLLAVLISLGFIVFNCTMSSRLQHAKLIVRRLAILLVAVILFLVIFNLMLLTDSYIKGYGGKIFIATFATLVELIVLCGYLLAMYSPTSCVPFCKKKKRKVATKQSISNVVKDYGTYCESDPVSVPSDTYFDVEYTGEFTTVQATQSDSLIEKTVGREHVIS